MRVSNELGAGHPKSAAFSVLIVNLISFIIAVMEAVVVLALRHVISYAFTSGETVAAAVSDLCPFLAVTLILNGVQPVLSGNNSDHLLCLLIFQYIWIFISTYFLIHAWFYIFYVFS